MSKKMEVEMEEVVEVKEEDNNIEVTVVEKQGFGARFKAGLTNVAKSKPAKIIAGIGLVAVGAVGALALALGKRNNSCDDVDDILDALPLDDVSDDVEVTEI